MKRILYIVLFIFLILTLVFQFNPRFPRLHSPFTNLILFKNNIDISPVQSSPTLIKNLIELNPHPKLAIIIDDVGLVSPLHKWAADFLKISAPLTWSVLPFRPYTRICAIVGKEHGFLVTLHLPVDPFHGKKIPGIGFIIKGSSKDQVIQQFEADLSQVPEAKGVNNHMGDLSPQDEYITSVLMEQVKKHNLFFIDSLTGPHSIIGRYAKLNKIPFAARDVFIDDQPSMNYKLTALHQLIHLARKYGHAIGIGHVRSGTAEAIIKILPELKREKIELVPVSELTKIQ